MCYSKGKGILELRNFRLISLLSQKKKTGNLHRLETILLYQNQQTSQLESGKKSTLNKHD